MVHVISRKRETHTRCQRNVGGLGSETAVPPESADKGTCLACCPPPRPRTQEDDDFGNYYDNFVDGKGY